MVITANIGCYDLPPIKTLDSEVQIGVLYRTNTDLKGILGELSKSVAVNFRERFFLGSELYEINQQDRLDMGQNNSQGSIVLTKGNPSQFLLHLEEDEEEELDILSAFSFAITPTTSAMRSSEIEDFFEVCQNPVELDSFSLLDSLSHEEIPVIMQNFEKFANVL